MTERTNEANEAVRALRAGLPGALERLQEMRKRSGLTPNLWNIRTPGSSTWADLRPEFWSEILRRAEEEVEHWRLEPPADWSAQDAAFGILIERALRIAGARWRDWRTPEAVEREERARREAEDRSRRKTEQILERKRPCSHQWGAWSSFMGSGKRRECSVWGLIEIDATGSFPPEQIERLLGETEDIRRKQQACSHQWGDWSPGVGSVKSRECVVCGLSQVDLALDEIDLTGSDPQDEDD
jgi:hypothetical protein